MPRRCTGCRFLSFSHDVDVFYLYPTAWQKVNAKGSNICDIDNPSMLAGSAAAFARSATAFEPFAQCLRSYYRQADAAYALSLPLPEHDAPDCGASTMDACCGLRLLHRAQATPAALHPGRSFARARTC